MGKRYTEQELRDIGMDKLQIEAILATYRNEEKVEVESNGISEGETLPVTSESKVVQIHQHNVNMHIKEEENKHLVPTSLEQIASYKSGTIVELPPFADGQPLVARMIRPSMLALIKSGKIPNSLLNQATSLFANGAGALNGTGKNATNAAELFQVIDAIVNAALL